MTRRTRPTRRLFATLALALAIYAVGANVAAGWVIAVGAAIAVASVWSAVGHARAVRRLAVVVRSPHRLDAGPAAVTVTVDLPRRIVGTVHVEGEEAAPAAALPAAPGRHDLDVPVVLARGSGQVPTVRLELTDPLGTVTTRLTLPAAPLTVRPARGGAHRLADADAEPDVLAEVPVVHRSGSVPDTELRRWRPGEPVRLVHWPTSLRRGELLARSTVEEARPRVTLGVPDGPWSRERLDEVCAAVRAEAEAQHRAGVDVEVTADGRTVPWGPAALDLLASLPPHAGRA